MNKKRRFSERWAKALAVVMVVGAIVAPAYTIMADNSQPRDNNANSIIWGGCYTKSECLDKMNNGDGHGHSAAEIMGIYSAFGITKSDLNSNNTVKVTVFKDGRVVIDQDFGGFRNGDVIATDSWSVGHSPAPNSWTFAGVRAAHEKDVFVSGSITGFANIQNGKMQWFILNSCGNAGNGNAVPMPQPKATPKPTPKPTNTPKPSPIPSATPAPQPEFQCVEMDISQPTKDENLFQFTIVPLFSDNVQLLGYRFTFSDNRTPVNTGPDMPSTNVQVDSGSLRVFGQVKTSAGTTPIEEGCSAEVNVTPPAQPGPSTTIQATPTPVQGQVLSVSSAPLPATGPETALGGVAGVSAIGVATRAYLRSRKSLMDSLRSRKRK